MKKAVLIFSLLLSFTYLFPQSPSIQWQYLSSAYNDSPNCVIQTNDSGYLVMSSITVINSITDCYLRKFDSNGLIVWEHSYGGSNNDDGVKVIQTNDGGYIFIGSTQSNDGDVTGNHNANLGNSFDVWVVKLNNQGIIQWQKCYGSVSSDYGRDIKQTSDGGYIIAASPGSNDGDVNGLHSVATSDFWLLKINSLGVIEWQKCHGGTSIDDPRRIIQTTDGGYLVGGETLSNDGDVTLNHGFHDFWVVKTNSTGNIEWQKSIGGSHHDILRGLGQVSDGYIVGGGTYLNTGDFSTAGYWRILKLNTTGGILWNNAVPGYPSTSFENMQINTQNSHILLIGTAYQVNSNIEIDHLNQDGFLISKTLFGGTNYDYAGDLFLTADTGLICIGDTRSNDGDIIPSGTGNPSNTPHLWVAKISPNLLSTNEVINNNIISVTPNPVTDFVYINSEEFKQAKVTVYDNLGRLILDNLDYNNGIDLSFLTSGLYFIDIKNEKGEIIKRKILKD